MQTFGFHTTVTSPLVYLWVSIAMLLLPIKNLILIYGRINIIVVFQPKTTLNLPTGRQAFEPHCPCANEYAFLSPHLLSNSSEHILKLPLRLTYNPIMSCWLSGDPSILSNRTLY